LVLAEVQAFSGDCHKGATGLTIVRSGGDMLTRLCDMNDTAVGTQIA
jgi:hypothetical protein